MYRLLSHNCRLYATHELTGGHVIALGAGNTAAAKEALHAYSGGMQVGGGITCDNAMDFIESGASHVIVTSFVFKYVYCFVAPKEMS